MRRIHLVVIFVILAATGWFASGLDTSFYDDVPIYGRALDHVKRGDIPYSGFAHEYPPLSFIPIAALPLALSCGGLLRGLGYSLLFIVGMALIGVVMAFVTAQMARSVHGPKSEGRLLSRFIVLCALGGQILALRLDLFPSALAAGAALALLRRKSGLAGLLLGLGTTARLYPALLLPGFALVFIAEQKPRDALKMVAACLGTIGLVATPFLLRDSHSTIVSLLGLQRERGLDIQSSYGGLVTLLGLVRALPQREHGAWHLAGPVVGGILRVQLPVLLLALVATWTLSWRALVDDVRKDGAVAGPTVVRICAMTIGVFILANNAFSPEYLAWLLPFVALLPRPQFLLAAALFAGTAIVYPHTHRWLVELQPFAILALNLRNATLLVLCGSLLRSRRSESTNNTTTHPPDSTVGPLRLVVAYSTLAFGVWLTRGEYGLPSVLLAATSTALLANALWGARLPSPRGAALVPLVMWVAAIMAIACGGQTGIAETPTDPSRLRWTLLHMVALIGTAAYLPEVLGLGRMTRALVIARRVLVLAAASALTAFAVHLHTRIDVWHVHQQGAALLLAGKSVYGGAISTLDTHTFARTIHAYSYPPMNLLLTTLAFLVSGETRWAQAACVFCGAGLLWEIARRRTEPGSVIPELMVILFLFHPAGFLVISRAWGEPLAIPFMLGFIVLLDKQRNVAAAVLVGLFIATKQQLVLALPFIALVPSIGRRGAAIAGATAAVTVLPFALWNPEGLWKDLVVHHLTNPFRPDSLSVAALFAARYNTVLPSWLGFVAALAALAAATRLPRTLPVQLTAATLAYMLFFLFGRQAFANYYYLNGVMLLAAFCTALAPRAASAARERSRDDAVPGDDDAATA